MSPKYKLTYFNVKGLGEPIRYILSYGGVEFDDVRVDKDKWPALKPNMPFEKLPTLEVDGKLAHQSIAICRYLAKQFDLAGRNDWENLEIDSIVDTFGDMRLQISKYMFENDEKKKEELKKVVFGEQLPFYLNKLEDIVKKNNGYFVGGRLTWADIYFVAVSELSEDVAKEDVFTPGRPELKALIEKVKSLPAIKSWIQKRPQ